MDNVLTFLPYFLVFLTIVCLIWTILFSIIAGHLNEAARGIGRASENISLLRTDVKLRLENIRTAIDRNTDACENDDEKVKFDADMLEEAREHLTKAVETIDAIGH